MYWQIKILQVYSFVTGQLFLPGHHARQYPLKSPAHTTWLFCYLQPACFTALTLCVLLDILTMFIFSPFFLCNCGLYFTAVSQDFHHSQSGNTFLLSMSPLDNHFLSLYSRWPGGLSSFPPPLSYLYSLANNVSGYILNLSYWQYLIHTVILHHCET